MIVTKTPFRISLFGGGSDFKEFYSREPGAVLSFSIDKFIYVSTHGFFEADKVRVKYSRTETVNNVSDLQHTILREAFLKFKVQGGLELSSFSDIPAGTGMGSSSTFTVAILQNLYERYGKTPTPYLLAQEACDIEINKLRDPIGKQDQFAAAHGGFNKIFFHSDETVNVEKLEVKPQTLERLNQNLLLFYTGATRSGFEISAEQKSSMSADDKFKNVEKMVEYVALGERSLKSDDLDAIGRMLDESWTLKKKLNSKIAAPAIINETYEIALKNGALGGKVLGPGGGGFMLFYCPLEKQEALRLALKHLRELPFKIENQGSRVVFNDERRPNG